MARNSRRNRRVGAGRSNVRSTARRNSRSVSDRSASRPPKRVQETTVRVAPDAGSFAENKDVARDLRVGQLEPALQRGEPVVVDFDGVSLTTQSFVHALLSEPLRSKGPNILDRITFRNCTPAVQRLIELVCEYTQEAQADAPEPAKPAKAANNGTPRLRHK